MATPRVPLTEERIRRVTRRRTKQTVLSGLADLWVKLADQPGIPPQEANRLRFVILELAKAAWKRPYGPDDRLWKTGAAVTNRRNPEGRTENPYQLDERYYAVLLGRRNRELPPPLAAILNEEYERGAA
jgi:hypothetical protein